MLSAPSHLDKRDAATPVLAACRSAATDAVPSYFRENVEDLNLTPTRSIGIGARSSLKASFWESQIDECRHSGDRRYASVVLHRGGGRVWRNNEATPAESGSVGMQPFESSTWRFEGRVRFVHIYVPFVLLSDVCESLWEREFQHEQLQIPMGTRDEGLCGAMRSLDSGLMTIEPTHLILDSWALILAEILMLRFSSHARKHARRSFGQIPCRGLAHVVDFVEGNLDQDLDLPSLASAATMSVYHFAHRFKETVGLSPHAYVLTRRISRARGMLERRESRLVDVAAACGFSSQAHFTMAFRRVVGVTPGAYRRAFGHPSETDECPRPFGRGRSLCA